MDCFGPECPICEAAKSPAVLSSDHVGVSPMQAPSPKIFRLRAASQVQKCEGLHPSHNTRYSDASTFDEICTLCGATDGLGTWGRLAEPCPKQSSFEVPNRLHGAKMKEDEAV